MVVQNSSLGTVKRPEAGALREGSFGGVGLVGFLLRESPVGGLDKVVGLMVAGSSLVLQRLGRSRRNTSL